MTSYCAVMLGVHKHAHTRTNIHTNAHTYWQLREQVLPSFLNPALKQDLPPKFQRSYWSILAPIGNIEFLLAQYFSHW